jgi:rhomboid family GlyGly-CTERM serine protease
MRRLPLITLILTATAVAIHLLGQPFQSAMEYDRAAVAAGQFWRLVTCQWVHWSTSHLVWDVAVFLVVGAACETRGRLKTVAALAIAVLAVPLAVHGLSPAVTNFRGLSGIDSALFGLALALIVEEGLRQRRWGMVAAGAAGISLFVSKCAYEMTTSKALFVESADFDVLPLAHLVGLAVGLGVGAFVGLIHWRSRCTRVISLSYWPGCRSSAAA